VNGIGGTIHGEKSADLDEFMAALGASRLSFVPGLLGKCERILGANNQLEQNGI
jgi:hypothetical protein